MIGFIFIAGILLALTVLALLAPLWRRQSDDAQNDVEIAIYRDQLAEVDRDLARGVLDNAEAERTRTEISRRLLSADANARATSHNASNMTNRIAAFCVGFLVIGATAGLYTKLGAPGYGDVPRNLRLSVGEERRLNRPNQLEAEALIEIPDDLDQFDTATQNLIVERRTAAFERPNDVAAWTVLVQTEAAIGQYHNATRAAEQVVTLSGPDVENLVQLLDLMVAGTQGYVSPEAETLAFTVLQMDEQNPPSLYYAGLMYAQNDRPDRAFALWRQVIEGSPQGTLHWTFAANQIGEVAAQLGIDYALPDQRGPSFEDIEAAQDMAPEDRRAMIEGMVGGLADRLATQGGPPQDWARLISALMVIEQSDAAQQVLNEAELIFGGDVQAVTIIRRAAQEAGLSQ